ncbi:FAD:protein FMN transferase, partial [uncultured Gemella sp.]|uniref:FAD:protein FMN transferase n=1 Tax=uncultured Gemella sp. TaxID=254352 RepID=UPI002633932D
TMIQDIENRMSNVITASEVSKINEQAGISPVKVSSDTFYVIERALYYSKLSNGKFDVSVAPLVNLWNISTDNPKVPSEKEINEVLPFINYKNIVLMDKNLQNIYIKYFLRLILPYEMLDIIVDEKDFDKYKKFLNTDNTDNCIIFRHKNRTKIFDNPEEKEEYIEQFKKIKDHKDIEIEGITSKELKIEEVILFDQYSCLIIR